MPSALGLIKSALKKIHVLGKGQGLDADEANDALEVLNLLLATWSAEGDLIFTESKETFNLSSAISYTIGSGADFDTQRPLHFSAVYVSQGEIDYTLERLDNQQYAAITQKNISGIPESYYYDAGFPVATIYLDKIPTAVSTITLYSFKPLSSFTSLNTNFSMPEEYRAALIYNLAVWLAPEYEREASPEVSRIASEAKSAVIAQNVRNELFTSDVIIPADRSATQGNIFGGFVE